VLAVGVVPGPARAEDDFQRYINAVAQLYASGESERALEQLQRARLRSWEVEQDVLVEVYEGLILLDLGQREQALAAFETGLLLDPEAMLPVKVSPKVSAAFEEVRKRVRKKLAQGAAQRLPSQAVKDPMTPHAAPSVRLSDTLLPGHELSSPAGPKPFEPRPELVAQPRSRVRVVPVVLGGVGVVAAGVGVVFGLRSRSGAAEVKDAYKAKLPAQDELPELINLRNEARSNALRANVMFGTAALAVGSAVVTWLLASDDGTAESKGAQ